MSEKLLVSLSEVTVRCNGRPKAAPRTMDVGLALQLADAGTKSVLAVEALAFRANAGDVVPAQRIAPALGDGASLPLFKGPVPVGGPVLLDVRFVVFYQNDLGPIVGAVLNRLVDFGLGKVPYLGDLVGSRLHLKVGERISEEYGRQTLLWDGAAEDDGTRSVVLDLVAPETIRGFYLTGASGRSAPRPASGVFLEAGEVAATVVLTLARVSAPSKRPKASARKKAPARAGRRAARATGR